MARIVWMLLAGGITIGAQEPAARAIGAVQATTTTSVSGGATMRPLPTGVLVNDAPRRRLLLFDSTLGNPVVVLDSARGAANFYGERAGALLAYDGDSSLFVDPIALTGLVVGPEGNVVRVIAIPGSEGASGIGNATRRAAYDGHGRLVYRTQPAPVFPPGDTAVSTQLPDSAAIVRISLRSRAVDTVAFVKIPPVRMFLAVSESDRSIRINSAVQPLAYVDDFVSMGDGTIAIVRGHDYHVDWVRPDGTRTSSAKIPFPWRKLSEADKSAFVDSVVAVRQRRGIGTPEVQIVPASQLPDYQPAFLFGATRVSPSGEIWIATIPTRAVAGGPVYDVIGGAGTRTMRVQLPAGRTLAAISSLGIYMLATRGDTTMIERAAFSRQTPEGSGDRRVEEKP